jgi:23S rRNA pseudouridine2605 synthase
MKPEFKASSKMSSTTPTTWPKLHKALAQAGLGSRLSMEAAIEQGRVKVGGQRATIGQRLSPGDKVLLDGKPVQVSCNAPSIRVLAYHKPVGEVVTHDDPENRPTVFGRLPRLTASKWLAIGRLDINTEGLLLITNSGDLANRLMHPSFGLDREYAVRVLGALTDEEKQRLLEGVAIDAGRPACFSSIVDETGDSDASEGGVNRWYRVVIAEGRNREVRRMIEAVGHVVSRLIRIRYGSFALPKGLKRGDWIELDIKTIRDLGESVGAPAAIFGRGAAAGQRPARQKLSRGANRLTQIANSLYVQFYPIASL